MFAWRNDKILFERIHFQRFSKNKRTVSPGSFSRALMVEGGNPVKPTEDQNGGIKTNS